MKCKQLIIAIEGIDGSGKTTIIKKISNTLDKKLFIYDRTKTPSIVKKVLNNIYLNKLKIFGLIIYMFIANINYLVNILRIINSDIVLMGRCFISNLCYFCPVALKNRLVFRFVKFFEPRIKPTNIFIIGVERDVAYGNQGTEFLYCYNDKRKLTRQADSALSLYKRNPGMST